MLFISIQGTSEAVGFSRVGEDAKHPLYRHSDPGDSVAVFLYGGLLTAKFDHDSTRDALQKYMQVEGVWVCWAFTFPPRLHPMQSLNQSADRVHATYAGVIKIKSLNKRCCFCVFPPV